MGLRFRKSVKICKGVRVNFSKSGASLSMGVKGARYTIGPKGTRKTVGIPGTGIYYTTSSNIYKSKSKNTPKSTKNPASKNAVVTSDTGETYVFTPEHVKVVNKYLDDITGFHKKCIDPVDWDYIENLEPPFDDGCIGPKEADARKVYDTCKPTVIEKLNKNAFYKRKQTLYDSIALAVQEDKDAYESWKNNVECAKAVKLGNIDAYYEAIMAADPFVDLSKYGTDIEFGTDSSDYMEIEFCSKIGELIPSDKITLTSTGKVSYSNYTKTEYYALCQDYVCSYAIRLARELFALLPVNHVIVHASDKMNNEYQSPKTILSVCFERSLIDMTDFAKFVDASDFVESCIHNMDFKKTLGFKEVERLTKEATQFKINPEEDSITRKRKLSNSKVKIELPWGWFTHNKEYIVSWEKPYYELRKKYYSSKNVDDKISNLKALIQYFTKFKQKFENKGVYFEQYFDEMHLHNAGKKVNPLKEWKKELEELQDGYLDSKEAEDVIAKEGPILRRKIIETIKNNPNILQKDLVKMFHPALKQMVLEQLWNLTKEGIVIKEKSGNSNALKLN